jgi:hypothetical protein
MALLLLLVAAYIPALAQSFHLPPQETLNYSVEWRLVTAGKATLKFDSTAPARPQVSLQLESIGLVSKLFKVEDTYSSVLNETFCTESTMMLTQEASRRRQTKVSFNAETRKASYMEHDLIKNSVIDSHEIEVPPCVRDVTGGLYYLRTLNLEPGQSTQIAVSDGKKSSMAKVEAQQREEIRTPAGTFRAIRYEAYLFNNVLYRRPAHLYVWLTDDRRRLPVQIRVRLQFTIGTITLQLQDQQ